MRLIRTQKYFWKILATIGVVSIFFQIITLSTLAYFMVVPLGQRAADDLANVMVHAAETWQALSPSERPTFVAKMKSQHDLLLSHVDGELPVSGTFLPYIYFLEKSLRSQIEQDIQIRQGQAAKGDNWFWADVPVEDSMVRIGFARSRIGVNPPVAFFLLATIGLYLTVMTAVKLTKRLTVPIERLHEAARAVGRGQWPEPIEIDSPEELSVLAQRFNRMSVQVRELLSNRTTLLAGIAHDLRTPLTQIQLALVMLPDEGGNPELMQSIQHDLKAINRLIDETLSISLELEEGEATPSDAAEETKKVIDSLKTEDVDIRMEGDMRCQHPLRRMALRRILTNLLVNAIRYGDHKPITVSLRCTAGAIQIEVMDRGPGIPPEHAEAVFRPFYRLELSRNTQTGGSGLGLAIVQQLADSNHWHVELLPRPGGGTIARLTIPRG